MPRQRTVTPRKIALFSSEDMAEAVRLVLLGRSVRQVAKDKNLAFQTLARYVQKERNKAPGEVVRMSPHYDVNKVFSNEQELELCDYIITCTKMFYGLPFSECRKIAYELAAVNQLKMPENWTRNETAGIDWMKGFMKRHSNTLSLRTPEGCSLSRSTSFNQHNVSIFFDNLRNVLDRNEVFGDGTRIFNLDETATTTVQKPSKVVAQLGVRQVSKVTSAEKGTLVTTCCIISGSGNALPPVMVFPRVHAKPHMIKGAPPGTLCLATKGGWMNSTLFLQVMQHYIKHSHSSPENPSLLLYDNHESHLSIQVLNLAKANGVTVLTFPPHSTNKLQPLDVGVFKPFATYYDAAVDSWMLHHPGQTFSIYDVAECVGIAHGKAMSAKNILSAFKKTGIYPFNRNVFDESDFLCCYVSDRPLGSASVNDQNMNYIQEPQPSVSGANALPERPSSFEISPAVLRNYPKASPRKQARKQRRKGRSIIATDTPIKNELESLKAGAKRKASPKNAVNKRLCKNIGEVPANTTRQNFRKVEMSEETSSSDSDSNSSIPYQESSATEEQCSDEDDNVDFTENIDKSPNIEDFILVKFSTKKNHIYYVGQTIKVLDDKDVEVSFLRKSKKNNNFTFPDAKDIGAVAKDNIVMVLPKPSVLGKTKRQQAMFSFDINLNMFNIN